MNQNNLKILTVIFSLSKGGTERAAVNFAIAYKRLGHNSKLITTTGRGPREAECVQNNILVYDYNSAADLASIQGWSPDIIHIHSHLLEYTQILHLHQLIPDASIVETNVFSSPSPWEHLLSRSFQLSAWCLWLYLQRGGNSQIATVVPNPIDCASFYRADKDTTNAFRNRFEINPDTLLFGRIGQAFDSKWSPLIITAFEQAKSYLPDCQLLLVNPPPSIVKRAAASKYRNDIIAIPQLVGDQSLRSAYSTIDLFLHAADQGESFGMVLAESLLCETPVVCLATPWADNSQIEVAKNNVCGYAVDSSKHFHAAVKSLLLNPHSRRSKGKAGRTHIITNYDSQVVAMRALQSLKVHPEGSNQIPSKIYQLRNGPNILTKLILDSYPNLDLTRLTCESNVKNVLLFLRFYTRRLLAKLIHNHR